MFFFSQLDPNFQVFLVAIFALIFGSFASLLTHRLTTNEPIGMTRSKCVACGCVLGIFNLIPVFSWLFQRGKCSKCKAKISLRYPAIELTFLLSFLTIFFALNRQLDVKTLLYFLIAATMIVMVVVDLEHYFIPNSTQYFLAILATLLAIQQSGVYGALANIKSAFMFMGFGLALWLFFRFAAAIDALGVDDIKFFFIAGLMLGERNFLTFMILSGIFGVVFGSLWQKLKHDETFPFAPAICFSAFVCLLLDKKINPIELLGSALFFWL